MKTAWLQIIGVGVLTTGIAAAAQSPQSTTSREVISATGCVQLAGATGAEATGEGIGPGFVLKGVRTAPSTGLVQASGSAPTGARASENGLPATNTAGADSAARAGDAGASGPDHRAGRDTGLLLVADRGVDLAGHVGHRVLVTGRLSSFAAAGGIASTSSGRTLTVTRVDLIAPACTTGS
jgi:hypothetical protein